MDEFKQYRRTQIAEMRPCTEDEMQSTAQWTIDKGISISGTDISKGSPKTGDMIARNPKNHEDQWLVAEQYFNDNFESIKVEKPTLSFYERLQVERDELDQKVQKLEGFLLTQVFFKLDSKNKYLLKKQWGLMKRYRDVLDERLIQVKYM
jgi:hypothetical protein